MVKDAGVPHPLTGAWGNRKVASQKSQAELLGLVRGILADGLVVEEEARFLMDWIASNEAIRRDWPGNVLFARIHEMLADRVLDADEQRELLRTLVDFVDLKDRSALAAADNGLRGPMAGVSLASPYDDPPPPVEHMGRVFVVTGDFASMSRKMAERAIYERGGAINNAVSKRVHYVLVGGLGSEMWVGGSYGTKIDKAVQLRNEGNPIFLVAEEHWYNGL